MHEPTDTPDDGDYPATVPVVMIAVGALAILWLFAVAAGCATGAEPPAQAPPVQAPPVEKVKATHPETPAETSETPAAGRGSVGSVDAPPPVQTVLLGWWRWDGRGNVWYEPNRPTPPGAVTYPAPGVAAPRPFARAPLTTPTTPATIAGPVSTSSPAPGRGPAPTRTLAPGVGILGSIRGCTSYG